MISINNHIFLKPYAGDKAIKATVSSGFASIKQKDNLIGLECIAAATLVTGQTTQTITKGSIVFFSEELLFNQPWATKTYNCDDVKEKFIIAPVNQITSIKMKVI